MIFLIGGCFFKLPYGYFQFMKIAVFVGCIYNAYKYYEAEKIPLTIVSAFLAILFNPFIKFAIKRSEWKIIDGTVIMILIIICLIDVVINIVNTKKATTKSGSG